MINVKEITREVEELLGDSGDGHGIDHVLRVRDMAVSFAVRKSLRNFPQDT